MSALPDSLLETLAKAMLTQEQAAPAPDSGDVIYFEKQMGTDVYDTMDSHDVAKKIQEMQMAKPSMGDAILNGIENVRTYMRQHGDTLAAAVASLEKDTTMVAALKFQYKIMAHGIYVISVTKFADKTNKGVQSLFRPQGG